MLALRLLPATIKRYYNSISADPANLDAIVVTVEDGNDTIEIQFKDDTADVWQWVVNTESRDPVNFPRHWEMTETSVPLDELAAEFDKGPKGTKAA